MRSWLLYGLGLVLAVGLVGCNDVTSNRNVSTEVTCRAHQQCDPDTLACTSTFDETFTTFQDEYGDGFDHHLTITDHTTIVRHEDVDAGLLATLQTETLSTYTVDDYITIDRFGHEDISRIETATLTITTWQQDCPTCLIWMCTTSGAAGETCHLTATVPALPVCTE